MQSQSTYQQRVKETREKAKGLYLWAIANSPNRSFKSTAVPGFNNDRRSQEARNFLVSEGILRISINGRNGRDYWIENLGLNFEEALVKARRKGTNWQGVKCSNANDITEYVSPVTIFEY